MSDSQSSKCWIDEHHWRHASSTCTMKEFKRSIPSCKVNNDPRIRSIICFATQRNATRDSMQDRCCTPERPHSVLKKKNFILLPCNLPRYFFIARQNTTIVRCRHRGSDGVLVRIESAEIKYECRRKSAPARRGTNMFWTRVVFSILYAAVCRKIALG